MALNGVIASFNTGTYTVTREVAGTYVDGRYVPGATSTFSIVASVQPTSGLDLKNLPEAQHGEELKVVYTETQLKSRTPTTAPDEITIGGEPWVVVRCEPWDHWGATHYRAYASRAVQGA